MKKTSLLTRCIFIASFVILSCSCNKIKDAIASNLSPISLTQANITITIPASNSTAQQTAFGTTYFDLDSAIQKQSGNSTVTYAKYAKHITITGITASLANGDANNNLNNLTYSVGTFPILVFNTTPDYNTATIIGGSGQTTPLADPYNWNIPVAGNTDLISIINGKNWAYGLAYKLQKPTTKDLQLNLTITYNIAFN